MVKNNIIVKDVMIKPAIVIQYDKKTNDAARVMSRNRVGSVIVVKDENPIGMLTDTDIIKKVVAESKKPEETNIKEIMSTPLIFISPEKSIEEAEEIMRNLRIKRLAVIEKNKIVGVISNTDIAKTCPEMMDFLRFRTVMREQGPNLEEAISSGICDLCGNYSHELTYVNDQWLCEECREE